MYAIIKTGGKQYRVKKDEIIDVECLNVEMGSRVEFEDVLFVNDGSNLLFGEPVIAGYSVIAEVVGDAVGPKLHSLKYQPRQNERTRWGHRQHYTRVKILEIGAAKAEKKAKAAPKKAATEETAEKIAKPKSAKTKAAPKKKAEE